MLLDELKRMKEELAAQENVDNQDKEEEKEVVEEEEKLESAESEEKKDEEEKPESEKKEAPKEEERDNVNQARLRREMAAEKRKREQIEQELAELKKAREPEQSQEEPAQIPEEFRRVIENDRIREAEREFTALEDRVKNQYPEYNAVATEYANALYQAFKVQNPRKSELELSEMTKRTILQKAGDFARAGHENPVEELYHEAREMGFTGKSLQKEAVQKEEEIKPDLKKVAENRKRSSGMTASSGRSEGMMTAKAATELTAAEWAKLPASEKRRLMYGG